MFSPQRVIVRRLLCLRICLRFAMQSPFAHHGIDARGFDLGSAIAAKIVVALVIDKDEDNVGTRVDGLGCCDVSEIQGDRDQNWY